MSIFPGWLAVEANYTVDAALCTFPRSRLFLLLCCSHLIISLNTIRRFDTHWLRLLCPIELLFQVKGAYRCSLGHQAIFWVVTLHVIVASLIDEVLVARLLELLFEVYSRDFPKTWQNTGVFVDDFKSWIVGLRKIRRSNRLQIHFNTRQTALWGGWSVRQ